MTLYHFTCGHGKADIGTGPRALLLPHRHPLLGTNVKLVWFTTLPEPEEEEVGLTSRPDIKCDRREYRYVIDNGVADGCRWWMECDERAAAPAAVVETLESFGKPETWWVSSAPIRARFDRSYRHRLEGLD